jgi:hypothetical protein
MDSMDMDHGMTKRMIHHSAPDPSPECYANNEPFQQTLAYCISTRCEDVELWEIEQYWYNFVAGRMPEQPRPKKSYAMVLHDMAEPPNSTIPADEVMTEAGLVPYEDWLANYNGDAGFEANETKHTRYA